MLGCCLPSYQQSVRLLTLVVTVVAAISGCVGFTPPPPPVQDESLVTGKPCLPPRWYDIVPGQTTVEEAMEIVKALPFVAPDSVVRTTRSLPEGVGEVVDWQYIGATHPTHGGDMNVRQGIIVSIRVFLPRGLRLADVLAAQGEPDLVAVGVGMVGIPLGEGLGHYFDFFYSEHGVMLSSTGYPAKEGQQRATLSPEITITEAEYFAPRNLVSYFIEVQGDTEESAGVRAKRYQPWPGLGKDIPVLMLMAEPPTPRPTTPRAGPPE